MPAKDAIHEAVKAALLKDGWTVTDPFYIRVRGTGLEIDLAAEKFIVAERNNRRIAVEIKSMSHDSIMTAFSEAIGKYRIYTKAINKSETERDRKLYLATSQQGYFRLSQIEFIEEVLEEDNISLIIVDINKNEIKKWIN